MHACPLMFLLSLYFCSKKKNWQLRFYFYSSTCFWLFLIGKYLPEGDSSSGIKWGLEFPLVSKLILEWLLHYIPSTICDEWIWWLWWWLRVGMCLLSAPPSWLTASMKRSCRSGVHFSLGLASVERTSVESSYSGILVEAWMLFPCWWWYIPAYNLGRMLPLCLLNINIRSMESWTGPEREDSIPILRQLLFTMWLCWKF